MLNLTNCEEVLSDGSLIFSLTIPSSPATKKNSNRIIRNKGFLKVIPSKRFLDYQKYCQTFFEAIRNPKDNQVINFGISVKIRVATDTYRVGDYTNYCQALGDILQHCGIIENDKWIHWTDGPSINNIPKEHWFIGVDKERPRIEIEVRRFRHPLEIFENSKKDKIARKLEIQRK